MSNRVCEILGIEKPVIQGPMVWLTDARLAAAVSNAGGMGSLGPNAGQTVVTLDPEGTAENMRLGMLEGDMDNGYVSVGNGISHIHQIKSCQAIVDELTAHYAC